MTTKIKFNHSFVFMMILFICILSTSQTLYAHYVYDEDSDSGGYIIDPCNADFYFALTINPWAEIGEAYAYTINDISGVFYGNWNAVDYTASHCWAWSDTWWTWDEPNTPPGGYVDYYYHIEGYIHMLGWTGETHYTTGSSFLSMSTLSRGRIGLDPDFHQYWDEIILGATASAAGNRTGVWSWTYRPRFAYYVSDVNDGFFDGGEEWSVDIDASDEVYTSNHGFGLRLESMCNSSIYASVLTDNYGYVVGEQSAYSYIYGAMDFWSY